MDFGSIAAISAAGMEVEKARLDASAVNLSNIHTTRALGGGPFRPLRVLAEQAPAGGFSASMQSAAGQLAGPTLLGTTPVDVPPRLAYEPGHPDADGKGFVAYPGVDPVTEMVHVMTAVRSYEANVIAMNAAKTMATKALEIGGGA